MAAVAPFSRVGVLKHAGLVVWGVGLMVGFDVERGKSESDGGGVGCPVVYGKERKLLTWDTLGTTAPPTLYANGTNMVRLWHTVNGTVTARSKESTLEFGFPINSKSTGANFGPSEAQNKMGFWDT